MERDLLILALTIRRLEQAQQDITLCYDPSTYTGEWARTEADHLIRILDRLQCADMWRGGQ